MKYVFWKHYKNSKCLWSLLPSVYLCRSTCAYFDRFFLETNAPLQNGIPLNIDTKQFTVFIDWPRSAGSEALDCLCALYVIPMAGTVSENVSFRDLRPELFPTGYYPHKRRTCNCVFEKTVPEAELHFKAGWAQYLSRTSPASILGSILDALPNGGPAPLVIFWRERIKEICDI